MNMRSLPVSIFIFLVTFSLPKLSYANTEGSELLASADVFWMVLAGALVFFMQAGFALVESGMARAKNSVNVIMKNFADVCVGSIAFMLLGYGLMFGLNESGWLGTDHIFFAQLGTGKEYGFLFFQMMFAATATTIASGAMAERTQFGGYLIGAAIICAVIYPVYGSWVWGGLYGGQGWLAELGFIDFAGSTVVHSVGGWCALAGIIVLGARKGRFSKAGDVRRIPGHNLTFMALGAFILWFGWFGFNAGSTLGLSESLGLIALNTHLAAAAGVTSVVLSSLCLKREILVTNTVNGGLAGLVSVTAGCATMDPFYALVSGFIGGVIMLAAEDLLKALRLDDVVGAVAVHGFAGAWGTIAAGLFYSGNMFDLKVVGVQFVGILAGFLWVFPLALLMYWGINKTVGLRANSTDERRGLDYTEHYELAYPEFQKDNLHNG